MEDECTIAFVLLQPTQFCNIDCSYCYLPDRDRRGRMSVATVERIFSQVFDCAIQNDQLYIAWHAGEPMVVPPDWYRDAFAAIDALTPTRVKVRHQFQTNATLIDEAWCAFLENEFERVEIRVSIDGPEEINDRHRRTRSGLGTFRKTIKGIAQLRARRIRFGVLSVLTREALSMPDEHFWFYDSIGTSDIAFNFEEIEGVHQTTSLSNIDAISSYGAFLRRFCELMRQHDRRWRVRQIDDVYEQMRLHEPLENKESVAGRYLSFNYRGDVATFAPELLDLQHPRYGNFILGNVHDASLRSLVESPKASMLARDIAHGVELCRLSCGYFELCGGRFCSNKLLENGTFASTETINCRFRIKATVDALVQDLADRL